MATAKITQSALVKILAAAGETSNKAAKVDARVPDFKKIKFINYDYAKYGSTAERKRLMDLSVEVAHEAGNRGGAGHCGIVTSCSDTNLDVVLDLAKHSQNIGADYVIVHSPVLHFGADTEETIYEYYRHISEQLDIGIAMWNHPDCGYLMSPQLCARIAERLIELATEESQRRRDEARRQLEREGLSFSKARGSSRSIGADCARSPSISPPG